ncbi:sugar phosphate isomerase/epimerase [Segetibacter sp. 3557_3]|uniref:sugar phosphate isomerase/epimerase family protein n=1 Tax=Segetibacter sp. 3557_3 TaxID=2547429 RepID=UPI001058AB56|nr:sugar phosphate isomerase/epimerase family protein [Segetibacter sp. 3557_3]TDH18460.1 sugar phosphate isomerase/epimerase [Segetibacter sp. 3557_3]
MNLTFINDEVSQDIDDVIRLCKAYGLRGLELRSLNNLQVIDQCRAQIEELRMKLDDNDITTACIDTPIFKCDINSDLENQFTSLNKALEISERLKCPYIRIFSFWRRINRNEYIEKTHFLLQKLLVNAKHFPNVTILLENGKNTMHANGLELLEAKSILTDENFQLLWDPGNCIFGGMDQNPISDGYPLIKDYIRHVHLKDPKVSKNGEKQYLPIGEGDLDIAMQLTLLKENNYSGYLSLETHWRRFRTIPEVELDYPGGHAFSNGGYEATSTSVRYLSELLLKHEL